MAGQNIDNQVVLNQSPDVAVVFFRLDDKGMPIRDVQDAAVVPDVDDIMSVSLAMGSTGTTGRFSITINNANNKYFKNDDIEKEIKNLHGGSILVSGSVGAFEYNTLPIDEIWLNANDFLTRHVYNRVVSDASVLYIYTRDPKDLYGDELDLLPEGDIKEELKKGAIRYRVVPASDLEAFAGNISNSQDSVVSADPVSPEYLRQSSITRTDISLDSNSANVLANRVSQENQGVSNAANRVNSTGTVNAAGVDSTRTDNQAEYKRLSAIAAASLLINSRTNAAFFEEFGGQLEHGRCLFEPMQLCTVFMSRRFLNIDPTNDMVVAFTGYVDSASDGFDGTRQIITITGSDVTKLMNITQSNINPSLVTPKLPGAGEGEYKIWQSRFAATEAWQVIKTLTVGAETPPDTGGGYIYGTGTFEVVEDVGGAQNFAPITDNVSKTVLYTGFGKTSGELTGATKDGLDRLFFTPKKVHIQTTPFNTSPVNDLQDYSIFKKLFGFSFNNWQNDYQSHLEIAVQVARLSNFEFYADAKGDIWYHQPRLHNYHILVQDDPEVYILRDEDILNWNLTESDENVITSVYVTGAPNFIDAGLEVMQLVGFYEDPSLVSKYGRRMISVTHPYVASVQDIGYFARSYLVRANVGRFVGKVTILSRPEIKMHMPVYIPSRNMIYYIENIEHSFTFGQRATTTLTLKYGRKPWEVLPEIFDYSKNASPYEDARDRRTPPVESSVNNSSAVVDNTDPGVDTPIRSTNISVWGPRIVE